MECQYGVPVQSSSTMCQYKVPVQSASTECQYRVTVQSASTECQYGVPVVLGLMWFLKESVRSLSRV